MGGSFVSSVFEVPRLVNENRSEPDQALVHTERPARAAKHLAAGIHEDPLAVSVCVVESDAARPRAAGNIDELTEADCVASVCAGALNARVARLTTTEFGQLLSANSPRRNLAATVGCTEQDGNCFGSADLALIPERFRAGW